MSARPVTQTVPTTTGTTAAGSVRGRAPAHHSRHPVTAGEVRAPRHPAPNQPPAGPASVVVRCRPAPPSSSVVDVLAHAGAERGGVATASGPGGRGHGHVRPGRVSITATDAVP